jgi:tripartite-type tricarboxylate transporter receptor subunit TctC
MRSFKQVLVAVLAVLMVQGVLAAYPEKPIRVVVPFPAGAAADNAMRVVALKLGADLGQPVVIENKAAVPGMQAAAMAPADGYTFLLGAGSGMVTGPLLKSKLPYNPTRDFVPVGRMLINVPILTAHPSVGVRSVKELIALAKQKPGRLDYSSSGSGSPGHLSMEMFQALTGTHMVHIPYKGGAPAVNELMGGHVHLGINALSSVTLHVKSGKLVPLAVASAKRTRALPDVPTMAEAGVTGFEYDIWYALFAPARTPPDIVSRVSSALQRVLTDQDVVRQLTEQGADAAPSSAQELARFIQEDTARWSRIIKDRNLKVD